MCVCSSSLSAAHASTDQFWMRVVETEAVKARFPHSRLLVRPLKPWKKKRFARRYSGALLHLPQLPKKRGLRVIVKKNHHRILTTRGFLCEAGKDDGVPHQARDGPLVTAVRRSSGPQSRSGPKRGSVDRLCWAAFLRSPSGFFWVLRHTPTEVGNACAESPDCLPYIVCSKEGAPNPSVLRGLAGAERGGCVGGRLGGWGVRRALRWPAARGSMGPDGGCTVPMLNRPSWEERRKGGEGRSRPRQAKNAIIVVVGAGRPLCLDGKGSGDTQDEPRDHWHILTDRLVACARHGGLGDHRPSPPHPPLGFGGYQGASKGC